MPFVLIAIFSIAFMYSNARAENLTGVEYKTAKIEDIEIFYREAGDRNNPTILLLHGFPTSSHMFRELMPALADEYHLIAPDYPGYGFSSMPTVDEFAYTFDNVARLVGKFIDQIGLDRYSVYLMDYGAPVGFRIATANPDRVDSLIVQNGNAYNEGIDNNFWEPIQAYWRDREAVNEGLDNDFWKNVKAAYKQPEMTNDNALRFLTTIGATKWQYTNGVSNVEAVSPDTWGHVQPLLDREGNQDIQLQMFYSYGSNPPLYPVWQEYLRNYQPPTLIVWGKNDEIFPAAGAEPYKRDLEDLEYHLIDTGHFALESHGQEIADLMRDFLNRKVGSTPVAAN
jgi:pimeloyl-ACP methyl ester carboxylesterase